MKYFKLFFIIFLVNFILGYEISEDNTEYRIEIIIFSFVDNKTNEEFRSFLKIPKERIVTYKPKNLRTRNKFTYSNFSNVDNYFYHIVSKNENSYKFFPHTLFRENDKLIYLDAMVDKINSNNDLYLIDTFSWNQTIGNDEFSEYLFYEDEQKDFGFYLKFYKKRFMHTSLKAYLGDQNKSKNIFIDTEKRIFNEEIYLFDHPMFGIIISINEN